MLPVISVECRYKVPAKLGDRLRVISIIDSVPMAKLHIRNEIYSQDNVLLCEGSVTLGFIDSTTRRPVRCPKDLSIVIEKNM